MDKVYMEKLIICTKSRRGSGKSEISPIRAVTEVFKENGDLIAENDPMSFTIENLKDFIEYRFKGEEREKVIKWAYEYFLTD